MDCVAELVREDLELDVVRLVEVLFRKTSDTPKAAPASFLRHDDSIKDYQRAIEISPNDPSAYYNLACRFALRKDAEEACSWLRKAIDKGFSNWEHIKRDSDLDSIRSAPFYCAIVGGR